MKHETMDCGKQYKCVEDSPSKGSGGMDMGGENKPQTPKKKQIMGGMPDDHATENDKDDY